MAGWLPDWIYGGGASSESDTERDGFASYRAEVHAIGIGLYAGLTQLRPWASELPDNDDVQAEPHYYKGSYVAGTVLQLVVIVTLSVLGVGLF